MGERTVASRCRTFRYLLQPTAKQRVVLEQLLRSQCELYNAALQERRGAWRWERRSVSYADQTRTLTGLREVRPDTLAYGTRVCRGTLKRLDRAFVAFYRRCHAGETPGFPRFKSLARFDSVQWDDAGGWRLDDERRRLYVQGLGDIRIRFHRQIRGVAKTMTVAREGRRWWVSVHCVDVPAGPLPATDHEIGIDLGVANLVTTSDGEHFENPRHGDRVAAKLAVAQRNLATKTRGSSRRRRAVERVARVHRIINNQRRNHAHQVSRRLVNDHDLIVHEDLQIGNMVRRPTPRLAEDGSYEMNGASAKAGLNRSIHDAGWGQLLRFIAYKAESAGREVIAVDPHHTSQTCAQCAHVARENRVTQAKFQCQSCGHTDHADINAARNILRAGRAQQATSLRRVEN